MKFCVHLQVGKTYCVNENEDANPHHAFFFQIVLLSLQYNTFGHFSSECSQDYGIFNTLIMKVLQPLMAIAGGM